MNMRRKKVIGVLLVCAMIVGICPQGVAGAQTGTVVKTRTDGAGGTASGSAVSGVATGVSTATGSAVSGSSTDFGLDVVKVNRMVGYSFMLNLVNIPAIGGNPDADFTSDDPAIASVDQKTISTDYTKATAKITLLSKGKTVIRARAAGREFVCEVKAVNAMSEADFGWYQSVNFIKYCKKGKGWKWAWMGEWGKPKKYGSTYRGVKIGMSMSDVSDRYGELSLKTCKKGKDNFLYIKQFNNSSKKLKVNRYTDLKYGKKYGIRIYFTPKNKVFGFLLTMNMKNINKMSKKEFKKYVARKDYKLI